MPSEFAALSNGEKQRYLAFIFAGRLNPWGTNTVLAFSAMFSGTQTLTNLLALRQETQSRAEELGLGFVFAEDVAAAREYA